MQMYQSNWASNIYGDQVASDFKKEGLGGETQVWT